jgi:hypothetical protein
LQFLSILQPCYIFKFFQVFSICSLIFPCFVCMCWRLRDDGPRQVSQSYGFNARNKSEEDEESAAAQAVGAAAAATTAKAAEVAEAAQCCTCVCKLEQT